MKLTQTLLVSALLAGFSSIAFAGPGPQFWAQLHARAAAKPVASAPAARCGCTAACQQAKGA